MNNLVGTVDWAKALSNEFRSDGGEITSIKTTADGLFEVTEKDGDQYTLNSEGIVVAQEEEAGAPAAIDTTGQTPEEIQARIDILLEEKAVNEGVMTQLKTEIERLATEAQAEIKAALDKQVALEDAQKEEVNGIISKQLETYQNSNGEMTFEEFQSNVNGAISTSEDTAVQALSGVTQDILSASRKLSLMDVHLGQMKGLIDANALIDTEIEGLEEQLLAAQTVQAAAAVDCPECPDPIGFVKDGVQYDFMIDADGDGALTDASEFLGAANQFEAMEALDTDGDHQVSAAEMEAAGVKLVAKDGSGQTIVDVSEVFNSDTDFVDLLSFNSDGKYDIEEGQQTLNGTFDVVFDEKEATEETITGYSTNDTMEYLNTNYEFSSGAAEGVAGAAAEGAETEFTAFYEQYTELSANLRLQLQQAYEMIGLSEEIISSVDNIAKADAEIEGGKIYDNFVSIQKQEAAAEEVTEEEVTEDADAAPADDDTTDVPAGEEADVDADTTVPQADDVVADLPDPDKKVEDYSSSVRR